MNQLYKKSAFPYILIIAATILSTLILWLPFIAKSSSIGTIQTPGINFETVLKHWDGPLYIIAAKTMYDPTSAILQKSPLGLSPKYFAAHLPAYPIMIKILATVLGYPKAMLATTVLFSILLFCFFYYFVKKLKLSDNPLALTLVFTLLTPRFLVVRSIGSPEPMFLLFILASLFLFIKEKYFWAGLFGALAVMTKTPGIILFGAYCLYLLSEFAREKRFNVRWLWLLLIPAGLFGVFALYGHQYGDFLAYFHSGDNIHLVFPPFSAFNYQNSCTTALAARSKTND
jgi:Gpi18-like mannosyltransferase